MAFTIEADFGAGDVDITEHCANLERPAEVNAQLRALAESVRGEARDVS